MSPPTPPTPLPPPPVTPVNAPVVARAQGALVAGVDGKTCDWCDAVSPPDAVRCVSCGAVFATPEGDEALERAARARIRAMEQDLRDVQRGNSWWPFHARQPR